MNRPLPMPTRSGLEGTPPSAPIAPPYVAALGRQACSVRDRPSRLVYAGTSTHDARRARVLGFERQEPDRRLRLGLDLRLALGIAAPRPADEPGRVGEQLAQLVEARRPMGVRFPERERVLEQPALHLVEQALDRGVGTLEAELLLLAGITAREGHLVCLQVAKAEVEP